MKKHEVLSALDRIREMTDAEIEMNPDWIRIVALSAYTLIKQKSK
ncbi:hypothetical protein [Brevibacillus laterosporus]|nr:hypothetical protein [Brevibacillus laterosporus]